MQMKRKKLKKHNEFFGPVATHQLYEYLVPGSTSINNMRFEHFLAVYYYSLIIKP